MRTNDRLLIAGLVAASLLPYLNAVGNGFAFDGRGMILQNPSVLAADTPLVHFFREPFHPGALYRPLAFYSYWLNQRLFGLAPAAYHAVNLGLHAIVTVLLYALCRSLHLGKTAAALAALFFAVHPIHDGNGARHWYDEALRIDPAHLKSNLNRGVILCNRGEIEAAEAAFRAGLEHHPGEPRLLTGMGFVRLAEGRVDEARDLLEEVRRVAPRDSETRRGLELALEHTAGVMKGS